jgi:SPP1 gp7 family putative phage head morphogenesis protein
LQKSTENSLKCYAENNENGLDSIYIGSAEKTVQESSYHADSLNKPYNTDDLYVKAGDYSIYEEMNDDDDQINVNLQLKKDLVLGSGFEIVAQMEGQEEIVNDLTKALREDPDVSFTEQLEEVLTAYDYGFSLSEKLFKKRKDGSLTWNTLKTRHPDSWLIHTDKKGNIKKYEQRGADTSLDINPKSLLHFVNNRRFQNPYGRSDLRAAYTAWFTKRHIIRYYGIFLEKAASPTPVAKYDKNAPNSAVQKIFSAIKKFQAKTALAIPKEIELDFLESKSNGEAFIKGINIFNMFIGRALFIPDLIGLTGSETGGGSFSLGQEQINLFFRHIQRRKEQLESIVNKEIIQPLIRFNWGDIENPPVFKLLPIKAEDAKEMAKIWIEAVKGRFYKPSEGEINHFRSLVGFPEGDVEEVAPEPVQDPSQQMPGQGEDNENVNSPDSDDSDFDSEPGDVESEDEKKSFAEKRPFRKPEEDFSENVDHEETGKQMDARISKIKNDTTPIVDDIFEDLFNQIEKKKIIEKRAVDRIDKLKLKKLKPLKQSVKGNLKDAFNDAMKQAQNELFKQRNFQQPLPSEEFLKILEEENFQFIGDWEFDINKKTRIELIAAIKDGRPLSSVLSNLSEVKKNALVSIERYARTKTTEVMNKGRLEFFDKSGVVDGYQFSAILDDRTTPICAGLHGKKFKAGDQPVPPLHFNCRSLLIPITRFQEFEPDKSVGGTVKTRRGEEIKIKKQDINSHIDEFKGKGFSKQ